MATQVLPISDRHTETAAPSDANQRARRFWGRMMALYEMQPHQIEILRGVCLQMTRADEAAAVIAKVGVCVADRYGALKENPAVGIERKARAEMRAGMHALNLQELEPEEW